MVGLLSTIFFLYFKGIFQSLFLSISRIIEILFCYLYWQLETSSNKHTIMNRTEESNSSLSTLEGNMYVEVNVYSFMSLDMESSVSTKWERC